MAKRYSGDLQISVTYDDRGFYRTSVSSGGKPLWRGQVKPAPAGFGPGIAYDSPQAYDEVAQSALAFADDEKRGLADDAEFDENLTGYLIRRSPRSKTSMPAKVPAKSSRFSVGDRVQIPTWHEDWMRGDRYGTVVKAVPGSQTTVVLADKSGRRRRWNEDFLTKV
jgi:hypothetical protein